MNIILSSSFSFVDEFGKPTALSNTNGFLSMLKKYLTKRKCCVIISGNPKKVRNYDPTTEMKQCFEKSGLAFDEYIYVDESNKSQIKEFLKRADFVDLCGGHLPTCNRFVNELNLKELLKNFNGTIFGASGGAMNLAEDVYCIPEIEGEQCDKSFQRHLKGIGLIDMSIIPHYNLFKNKVFSDGTRMFEDVLVPDSYKTDLYLLPDDSFITIDDHVHYYGEIHKLSKGKIRRIN